MPHPGDETGAALGVEGEAVEAEPGGLVPDRCEFGEASAQESMDLCLGESVDGADGVEDEASGKGIDEEDLGLPRRQEHRLRTACRVVIGIEPAVLDSPHGLTGVVAEAVDHLGDRGLVMPCHSSSSPSMKRNDLRCHSMMDDDV